MWLSNEYSKRLTHKWRSEADAILVGAGTVLADNPRLTNRFYFGRSPLRIVLSRHGKLPESLEIFNAPESTHVYTETPHEPKAGNVQYHYLPFNGQMIANLLKSLAARNIASLMIEGGIKTLRQFIQKGYWDEARVFIAGKYVPEGRMAPFLPGPPEIIHPLGEDRLLFFRNH